MARPTIKSPCIADRYVTDRNVERVAEVHSARLGAGCLISVRETDSRLVIEVYHADANVEVRGPRWPGAGATDWKLTSTKPRKAG